MFQDPKFTLQAESPGFKIVCFKNILRSEKIFSIVVIVG